MIAMRLLLALGALRARASMLRLVRELLGSVNLLPQSSDLSRPDWLTYSGGKDEFALRPVTAADLVSAEGQCAMAAAGAATPMPAADRQCR